MAGRPACMKIFSDLCLQSSFPMPRVTKDNPLLTSRMSYSGRIEAARPNSRVETNAGQPVVNVAYVLFRTKKSSKIELHHELFCLLSAGFSSLRKFCKLLPQRLRWPFREEVKVGSTQQQKIVQFRGSGQHHVKVQPPFIIFLPVTTTLLSAAVNDDSVAHCSPLTSC